MTLSTAIAAIGLSLASLPGDATPLEPLRGYNAAMLIAPFEPVFDPAAEGCAVETSIDHVTLHAELQRFVIGGHASGGEWRQCAFAGSELRLWDLTTGEPIQILLEGATASDPPSVYTLDEDPAVEVGEWATDVVFIPQRSVIAAAIADSTVRFWDSETGAPLGQWQDHEKAVWAIAASADGRVIATGSADRTVQAKFLAPDSLAVWRSEQLATLQAVRHLQLSDDGHNLVAISGSSLQDTVVQLWHVESGQWLPVDWQQRYVFHELQFSYTHQDVAQVVQLRGDRLITGHEDGVIRLWDAPTGVRVLSLQHHREAILSLAVSPDGQWLASSAGDGTKLWNLKTGQLIRTLDTIGRVQFSGENTLWVSQRPARTERWNWRLGEMLATIPFYRVVISRDGEVVAGYDGREIELWR